MKLIRLKKAAMFGLDARIALAIFGALSVISGAALYSAIQKAKVTALIVDLNELTKAYDSYYLDTGEELTVVNSSTFLEIEKLVSSTVSGWNGPYLPYSANGSYSLTYPPVAGKLYIIEALDGTWTANTSSASWNAWGDTVKCDGGTVTGSCFVWSGVRNITEDMFNAIDLEIDGTVNAQAGNARYVKVSTGAIHLFIKDRAKQ
tara:strand:- start:81 stop:692 length:612 start_codon:yes stop_codon:yes gene_type:complete